MNSNDTILITGATGFIGRHLTECLVKSHRIKVLVRKTSQTEDLENLGAELVYGDLGDIESLKNAVNDVDIVYHLAEAKGSLKKAYNINVNATKALINFSQALDVKRFVYVSTVAVMGNVQNIPVDETGPYDPYPLYFHALSKTEGERYGFEKFEKEHLPFSVIRPAVVYSKASPFFLAIVDWMKKHKYIGTPILGQGNNTVHCAHIEDMVQALVLAATKYEAIGNAYIIVDDRPVSWNDFLEAIAHSLNIKLRVRHLPIAPIKLLSYFIELITRLISNPVTIKPYIYFFTSNIHYNNSKAKRELGFRPKFPDPIEGVKHEII